MKNSNRAQKKTRVSAKDRMTYFSISVAVKRRRVCNKIKVYIYIYIYIYID